MDKEEPVSREEFEQFAKTVKDAVCSIEKALREPQEAKLRFYRCSEDGCRYVTDDLGAYVEHVVGERLKGRSSESPAEEEFGFGEQPKRRRHRSAEEFMDCPDCAPKFERVLTDMGWLKPQPKPEGGLRI